MVLSVVKCQIVLRQETGSQERAVSRNNFIKRFYLSEVTIPPPIGTSPRK